MKPPFISLIVPFYNESSAIPLFFERIFSVIDNIPSCDFEIICVDDGSDDHTLKQLLDINDPRIVIIELSRNFKKEAALTAGIDHASGDAVIPIDSDLQDPPELIADMIHKWQEGYEVVLAKRADRSTDSWLKRTTAKMYYKTHNSISDFKIPENVGDFRLMDRCVVEALKLMSERQRFMKGLFAYAGFKQTLIEFKRAPRAAGNTKWSKWKLWNYAIDGITSFSTLPLRIWTYIGVTVSFFSFFYAIWTIIKVIIRGVDIPGYASILTAILFLGGIQLIGIGVLGEYLGRAFLETKRRPIYIVRKIHSKSK